MARMERVVEALPTPAVSTVRLALRLLGVASNVGGYNNEDLLSGDELASRLSAITGISSKKKAAKTALGVLGVAIKKITSKRTAALHSEFHLLPWCWRGSRPKSTSPIGCKEQQESSSDQADW